VRAALVDAADIVCLDEERETVAERFRHRHHIGADTGPFMGEELARAAHAALHLVEHQ